MKTLNYPQPGAPMQGYATVPATSDAKEYLRLLLRHKFGLLCTLLLGLALAWLYLISTKPVYESTALVEVKPQENIANRRENQQIDWTAPTIKEETNFLRSRRVLEPVIDRFDLRTSVSPNRVPVLADVAERLPVLGNWLSDIGALQSYAWTDVTLEMAELDVPRSWQDEPLTLTSLGDDAWSLSFEDRVLIPDAKVGERLEFVLDGDEKAIISVAELDAPAGVEFAVNRLSLQGTLTDLSERLSTETSDTKSRMITVKLRGEDPATTAELNNAVIENYANVKMASENRRSDTEFEFFQANLPQAEEELRAAEQSLSEFRRRNQSYDQDVQTTLKLQQLAKMEGELLELNLEKDENDKRYTNDHPSNRRLITKIDTMRESIARLSSTIRSAPDVQRTQTQLEEAVESKRTRFNDLTEKLQTATLARGGNVASVQVIDSALAPRKPVSPNPLLAVVGGTLATLFLYMLYLTLRSALSTVISDQDALERASGLPVYMNIPKSSAQRRLGNTVTVDPRRLLPGSGGSGSDTVAGANVLALNKPEDFSIENLRGLRSMLEDLMAGASNNVLMFTSPLPSMGKSFLSLNLAVLVAQTGKRVLLIDADYQRGQLHKSLGLPVGPGLPEVVRGKSELKETVKPTSVANLYCIPRGFSGMGLDSEMPSDKEFGAFIQVVAPRFDIAIVDTPPVLSVSTAASLGKHAGSTIMVVKEGQVKEPQLNEALKRLSFSGVRVSGCIMNGSSAPTPRHYTYYREQLD